MERHDPTGTPSGTGLQAPDQVHDLAATGHPSGNGHGFDGTGRVPVVPGATQVLPRRRPRVGQQFVPTVFFGSIWLVLALFIGLAVLALNIPAPLGDPADPLNKNLFLPRPEWYFLFLFQILKIFQGPLELVGTVVIPGIATVVLILLPFYDRNWHKRPGKRPVAMTLVTVSVLGLLALTWQSQGSPLPFTSTAAVPVASGGGSGASGPPTYATVYPIFQNSCAQCHFAGGTAATILNLQSYANLFASTHPGGPVQGPVVVKGSHTKSYLWDVLMGQNLQGGAQMPLGGSQLPQDQINIIAQWIDAGAKEK